MLTLKNLFSDYLGKLQTESFGAVLDQDFLGVSIDSRSIREGEVFFAVKGKNLDGHAYVAAALNAGAALAVVNEDFLELEDPRIMHVQDSLLCLHALARTIREHYNPLTVAVTGSVGKTTTKNHIGSSFSEIAPTVFSKKSFNNEFGIPLTLVNINEDTKFACIEVGINTPGEMEWLAGTILPDIAVITNIGLAHVGRFGSIEVILKEKAKLLDKLRPNGIAVLNADDQSLASLKGALEGADRKVLWFGTGELADVRMQKKEIISNSQNLSIQTPKGEVNISVEPSDQGTMYACLASVSVGIAAGIDPKTIASALTNGKAESRLRISSFPSGRVIDDTYNASVASVLNGINLIRETGENAILVLGDLREVGDFILDSYVQILKATREIDGAIICVGETGETWREAAKMSQFSLDKISIVEKWGEAVQILAGKEIPANTCIFIKGSRFSHLERVALFMEGKKSACDKVSCSKYIHCSTCPSL